LKNDRRHTTLSPSKYNVELNRFAGLLTNTS
jgi:hypothetical protein